MWSSEGLFCRSLFVLTRMSKHALYLYFSGDDSSSDSGEEVDKLRIRMYEQSKLRCVEGSFA